VITLDLPIHSTVNVSRRPPPAGLLGITMSEDDGGRWGWGGIFYSC